MEEDIVECTPTISFSNVGMANFIDPHKVVVGRNAFIVIGNVQNQGVLEVRTNVFGHGGLKHLFSQVEGNLDLQEIPKSAPLPKKITTKRKAIIVTMKEEDEEGEKAGKKWADGEVLHQIAL